MNDLATSLERGRVDEEHRIAAVLTRYAVACDERDRATLAELFHPDATAVYDVDADLQGNTAIAEWIHGATAHLRWQQHALRVMTIDLDGDTARAVSYLTSHQVSHDAPDTTLMMNSRYDTVLERLDDAWRIRELRLTVGTVEHRPITLGSLVAGTQQEATHD